MINERVMFFLPPAAAIVFLLSLVNCIEIQFLLPLHCNQGTSPITAAPFGSSAELFVLLL